VEQSFKKKKKGALATLMAGGTVILPPSKDPAALVEAMDEHEATV
jgi:non-ribosomal peptide synthetase component E (peptide arylation enzyme)